MWGAVVGDIAGSRFEGSRGGPKDFELFHRLCTYTDDTVCTAAIADIILNDRKPDVTLQRWCRRHPGRGYGGFFHEWIRSDVPTPYGSFGNGAAMRVSPVALVHRRQPLEDTLDLPSPGAVTARPRLCERHRRSLRRPYVACWSWRFSERSRSTSPSSSATRERNARCFIRSRSGELRSSPLSAASRAFNVSTSLRSAAAREMSARSALTSSCLARSLAQARSCNDRKPRAAQRSLTSSQRCASSCCCSATHREHPDSFAGASTAAAPTPPRAMIPCSHPVAIHRVYRNPESVSSAAAASRCHYKSSLHATNERLHTVTVKEPVFSA